MKKINVILPAFAILTAIAGAYAHASTKQVDEFAPIPVVTNTITCLQTGHCSDIGSTPCKTSANGSQLFEKIDDDSCLVPAVGNWTP